MDRESLVDEAIELLATNEQLARTLEGLLFAAGNEGMSTLQIAEPPKNRLYRAIDD